MAKRMSKKEISEDLTSFVGDLGEQEAEDRDYDSQDESSLFDDENSNFSQDLTKSTNSNTQQKPTEGANSPMEDMDPWMRGIVERAQRKQLSDVAPNENVTLISKKTIREIIRQLAQMFGMSEELAFIALCLLFLKGAASASAPKEMEVILTDPDTKTEIVIQKYDLMACYRRVTGNLFIRRLAEGMALEIGMYAESQGLNGDLALKINNGLVAKNEPSLTTREKAWCSSFCQNLPHLDQYAGNRVPVLLAANLQERIKNQNKKQGVTPAGTQPRSSGGRGGRGGGREGGRGGRGGRGGGRGTSDGTSVRGERAPLFEPSSD